MKKTVLTLLTAFSTATSALAGLAVPDTLTNYIALGSGGATIGSTLFSDFMLLPLQNGAVQIDPNSILVNPINLFGNPGFAFVVNQTANTGELFEMRISYKVTDPSITGASVALTNSVVDFDGANTALLDLTGPVPQQTLIAFDIGLIADNPVAATFASVGMLTAEMDLVVDGGTFGGATLASGINQFTVAAIPEPVSIGFGLATLLVCGTTRLRRRRP
jgi:hypothetical protein